MSFDSTTNGTSCANAARADVPSISANPHHGGGGSATAAASGPLTGAVIIDLAPDDGCTEAQGSGKLAAQTRHDPQDPPDSPDVPDSSASPDRAEPRLTQEQMLAAFRAFRQLVKRHPDEAERVLEHVIARSGSGSLRDAIEAATAVE